MSSSQKSDPMAVTEIKIFAMFADTITEGKDARKASKDASDNPYRRFTAKSLQDHPEGKKDAEGNVLKVYKANPNEDAIRERFWNVGYNLADGGLLHLGKMQGDVI
jgi:hypothetical protein